MLIDKAQLLTLSAPEMTVLVGGMRVLGTNVGNCHGVFTATRAPCPTISSSTCSTWAREWKPAADKGVYEGMDRKSGKARWTGTRVDLVFGSELPVAGPGGGSASSGAKEKFVKDFVAAWTKVMNMDRFDPSDPGAVPRPARNRRACFPGMAREITG